MNESTSYRIAVKWKQLIPDHPVSIPVLKFSIDIFLNVIPIIGFSLLISVLTGRTSEVLIVMAGFALLRQLSGGYHFNSSLQCFLISTTGITLCSFAQFESKTMFLLITIVNIILFAIYSPSNIEKQSRIKKRYYPLLKILSIIVVVSSLFTNSPELITAFLIQGLSLIKKRRKEGDTNEGFAR